jgi:DNA-binding NarL/FixJ family response regulator
MLVRRITILLLDDHRIFRTLAAAVLREQCHDELVVVGAMGGGTGALAATWSLQPQVILLGLGRRGVTDLQVIPHLCAIVPAARINVLGLPDISSYRHAALAADADAFVDKDALHSDLLLTFRRLGRAVECTQLISG